MASERIGAITGLGAEARIARKAGWMVAVGGGTADGAERAARALIARGATMLVSCGLAGGLDPALGAGTVLVPETILFGESRYAADRALCARLRSPKPSAGGALFGATSPAVTVDEKCQLFRRTSAVAVDLETGPLARLATGEGLPFAALRVICDPAWRALPPAALLALSETGAINLRRVLASLRRHPGQLPALVALGRDAIAARRALVRHIDAITACAA
ncbi:MAG: hypothetical protein J2P47_16515 [Acetobacteraceae bacterium]|nr:hypothetical protein [Acetobacteraceae bacterium]